MRSTLAGLALVAVAAAKPVPQSSSSCSPDYSGSFEIQVLKTSSKVKRSTALTLTLSGGVLMDADGRTGYIASNYQFQFDAPPQGNAIEVDGFSVCGNMLAHQGDTTWQQCLSGDFYNLYSDNKLAAGNAGQCEDVNIEVIGAAAPAPSGGATQISDGQVTASAVTQISDGQVQATTAVAPVTQISDGQIQATTAAAPVTQISDGQVQATTAAAPVTQITDGQPQAPTAVVTQITDGQPQAPTAVVTQITDGQPQAPTAPVAPVTQITDGQPQAPIPTCTQIVDGQPQCPVASGTGMMPYPGANTTVAGSTPSASVVPATGAASSFSIGSSVVGLVAAVAALAMF